MHAPETGPPLSVPARRLRSPVYRVRRAFYITLGVGAILTSINQVGVLLAGAVTPLVVGKILLTYAVPYSVSTFSTLSANRDKKPRRP